MKLINISSIQWDEKRDDLPDGDIINYTRFGFDEKYIYPDYEIINSIETYLFETHGANPVSFDWDIDEV